MREISAEEVAEHKEEDDLWIIWRNKVYDLSGYAKEHPGGKAILRQAGQDATQPMAHISSHRIADKFINKKLGECCIGTLKGANHLS